MPAFDNLHLRRVKPVLLGAGALAVVLLAASGIDAHKGVTSKYMYNEDVFPILRDKCGRCHVAGGAAPMSLMSYKDDGGGAFAWAESMREMLVSEAMPPWFADPTGPAVKNSHTLTARELDTLVTWATGGTPQGDPNRKPAPVVAHVQWTFGKPDLALAMDKEHTVAPNVVEETIDVTLPTNFAEAKWVKAVDLLPDAPSMVRRAIIRVQNGPVLAVWQPGDDVTPAPGGTAFRLPAGGKLQVQIYYKKSWQEEQQAKSDRSTVGLYFTDEPLSGKEIQAFAIDAPKSDGEGVERSFGGSVSIGGRVLAIRPMLDQPYASVEINAVAASGKRVPLLKLRAARPEWSRRYWLADPVELPSGTKIEVKAIPGDPDSGPLLKAVNQPLQIAFDIVPQ